MEGFRLLLALVNGEAEFRVALAGMELGTLDFLLKSVDLDALLLRVQSGESPERQQLVDDEDAVAFEDAYGRRRFREAGGSGRS